jgi:hypothetical protein
MEYELADMVPLGFSAQNIGSTFNGTTATMHRTGVDSSRLEAGNGLGLALHSVHFSARTGDIPMQIQSMNYATSGKLVLSGGAIGSPIDPLWLVEFFVVIRRFDDIDFDGYFWLDHPYEDILFESQGQAQVNGVGYQEFAFNNDMTSPVGYILEPNSSYAFSFLHYGGMLLSEASTTSYAGTTEMIDPTYLGDTLTFTMNAVPEPATLAALGLGALALIRKRRRAIS